MCTSKAYSSLVVFALVVLGLTPFRGLAQSALDQSARTILDNRCLSCHGEVRTSGLDIRTKESILKGGKRGAAVVPGRADESLLYQAVAHSGEFKMPPGEEALSAQDLDILREWISQAPLWIPPLPPSIFTDEQKAFWSFQQVQDPQPPEVKASDWVQSPLDRFILAKLEEQELSPGPPADRRTLIRRVTFDLLGLPPTPEEIDAFLADDAPEKKYQKSAFPSLAKLVDRLLDSPHYGERWSRHWLDVVRYADTTAHDGNFIMRYAYRYRDYVVRSFNEDKPYDQFIIEQLAGDLLPATQNLDLALQRKIALGFLMLGPKALAEQDKEKMVLDIVDEQINVMGRAFLGLTVGCARCHDHKFDPIPTRDYYSIAGIFKSTQVMEDSEHTSMWVEQPVLEIPGGEKVVVMAPREGTPTNLRVHIRGNHHNLGEEVPRGFLRIITGENNPSRVDDQQSGRLELARWIANTKNPLTARVLVNRIWQGHFGTGLVPTSDNFGALGERPSHPELLDWLASRFIESGWSIKAMHRLILLSSTYQMQSLPKAEELRVDPNNRLRWRMTRHRLETEELRDAILAISGRLDLTVGGTIFDWEDKITPIEGDRGLFPAAAGKQDFDSYNSRRRSIYLPVVRNQLMEMFQTFDFANPNDVTPKRTDTTVAPQALFLMNSPFVREQSLHFAKQLLERISDHPLFERIYRLGLAEESDEHRLRLAHLQVLGRAPGAEELAQAVGFLSEYTRRLRSRGQAEEKSRLAAWQSYCQSLFCLNEFLYVN